MNAQAVNTRRRMPHTSAAQARATRQPRTEKLQVTLHVVQTFPEVAVMQATVKGKALEWHHPITPETRRHFAVGSQHTGDAVIETQRNGRPVEFIHVTVQ